MAKIQGKPTSIEFITLSEQIAPTFSINKKDEYVHWGVDNLWGLYLQSLLAKSAIHNSIFRRKVKMTYGNGLFVANENELTNNQKNKINKFLFELNPDESTQTIIKKISYDLQLYGGFALEIIYSKDKSKIVEIHHIDFNDVRCGKIEDGKIKEYFVSSDWKNLKENPYEQFNAWNPKKPGGSQIMYVRNYDSGQPYYPIENYRGGLNYINIDYYISNYHVNNLRNGLTPTVVISLPGPVPTEEERDILFKKIKKLYSSSDNAGKFILVFPEDGKNAPTITPIAVTDSDKQFVMLNELTTQGIVMAHNVTSPMLFGIKTQGQLGGRNEIITQAELFYNDVISQDQQMIEEAFSEILYYNNFDFAKVLIKRSQSVKFMFSDAQLEAITTIDERRKMIDLPEKGDENSKTIGGKLPPTQQPTNDPTQQ